MAIDQREFYTSLRSMRELTSHALLVDKAPNEVEHNIRARILRHGIVVCSFSSVETYLGDRLEKVFQRIAQVGFPYSSFSADLQNFLLVEAISGLENKLRFLPKADKLQFADSAIRNISKFDSQHPTFTTFGFSPKGSNMNESDVVVALKALGIASPWPVMSQYATQIGSSSLSLKDDFESI